MLYSCDAVTQVLHLKTGMVKVIKFNVMINKEVQIMWLIMSLKFLPLMLLIFFSSQSQGLDEILALEEALSLQQTRNPDRERESQEADGTPVTMSSVVRNILNIDNTEHNHDPLYTSSKKCFLITSAILLIQGIVHPYLFGKGNVISSRNPFYLLWGLSAFDFTLRFFNSLDFQEANSLDRYDYRLNLILAYDVCLASLFTTIFVMDIYSQV